MALKRAANDKAKMKRKAYEKELRKLQVELCHLQDWVNARSGGAGRATTRITRGLMRGHRSQQTQKC
jgi:hypothetical protein